MMNKKRKTLTVFLRFPGSTVTAGNSAGIGPWPTKAAGTSEGFPELPLGFFRPGRLVIYVISGVGNLRYSSVTFA